MATEETRDPIENNLDDKVLVDNPAKPAHEDQVPATQKELDAAEEAGNLRDGKDVEAGKTQRELQDERRDDKTTDED